MLSREQLSTATAWGLDTGGFAQVDNTARRLVSYGPTARLRATARGARRQRGQADARRLITRQEGRGSPHV